MIRPILFASIAVALVGGAVRAQQGAPRNPQKLETKIGKMPAARHRTWVFQCGRKRKGTRSRKAGVRDRLHARETKLSSRFERLSSDDPPPVTLAGIRRRPQREVKSLRPRVVNAAGLKELSEI